MRETVNFQKSLCHLTHGLDDNVNREECGKRQQLIIYFIFPAKSGFHLCTVIHETISLNRFLHDKIFLTVFPCTIKLPHGSHIRIRSASCSKNTFPQGGGAQINNCIYCLLSKHKQQPVQVSRVELLLHPFTVLT